MPSFQVFSQDHELPPPLVVGTIHQPQALDEALGLVPGAVDLLEWRVDALAKPSDRLPFPSKAFKAPLLITVRHPAEGGIGDWPLRHRRFAYEQLLPWASLLDIEVRSWKAMAEFRQEAAAQQVPVMASYHDFQKTPELSFLKRKISQAMAAGADGVKIACQLNHREDLRRLATLISSKPQPLALMGMGALGQASRLALATLGSRLNYGYLGEAQVPGQWHAPRFKNRLREIGLTE